MLAGGETAAAIRFSAWMSPSRGLLPSLRFLLEGLGLALEDVSAYAVAVGPGSFTGIRVGLATVRGLAMATGRPLAGISSFAAVAEAADDGEDLVAPWLEAGRGEVYGALFGRAPGGRLTPAPPERSGAVGPPGRLLSRLPPRPIHFAGGGAVRHAGEIRRRPGAHRRDRITFHSPGLAAAVARLGQAALEEGTAAPCRPCYIRPPDATRGSAHKEAGR